MESAPKGSVVVEKVATPAELTVPVPSKVPPFWKLTVPNGEPVGAGVTVAVSVTLAPAVGVRLEDASAVVVGGSVMVSGMLAEVEAVDVALPE